MVSFNPYSTNLCNIPYYMCSFLKYWNGMVKALVHMCKVFSSKQIQGKAYLYKNYSINPLPHKVYF